MNLPDAISLVNRGAKREGLTDERRRELYRWKWAGIQHGLATGEIRFAGWHNDLPTYEVGQHRFHAHVSPGGATKPKAEKDDWVPKKFAPPAKQQVRNAITYLKRIGVFHETFTSIRSMRILG